MILSAALALSACASSVEPNGGYATYDALARATAVCNAKGGHLALVKDGNARKIQDYSCEKTKADAQ